MKIPRFVFWFHLALGVTAGGFILIMTVTGAMLAFRPQLIAWAEKKDSAVTVPAQAKHLGLNDLADSVHKAQPDFALTSVLVKSDPAAAVVFNLGRGKMVYVNPYTGTLNGQASGLRAFMEKVEVWHRWFGMQGNLRPVGENVKKIAAGIFLLLLISGGVLWLKAKVWRFNPSASGHVRDWNWHNVLGFWTSPLLLALIVTGLVMAFSEGAPTQLRGGQSRMQGQERNPQRAREAVSVDLQMAADKAAAKVTGWVSMNIRLPQRPQAPLMISVEEKGRGPFRSQMTMDPDTGEIRQWETFSDMKPDKKIRAWSRFLHTGEALGLWGQCLAFAGALAGTALAWTGLAMALRRFKAWRKKHNRSAYV